MLPREACAEACRDLLIRVIPQCTFLLALSVSRPIRTTGQEWKADSKIVSKQCIPSPDGQLIATVAVSSPSTQASGQAITLRATHHLQLVNTVHPPGDLCRDISSLVWSPSSQRLLISGNDQIRVYGISDASLFAVLRNPASGNGKPTYVGFGYDDHEVLVMSAHGLKLSIFNILTSKAVEIPNPKFHQATSATKGLSFNVTGGHLALLTRSGGRDFISVHCPRTREVVGSWSTETIDANGLVWTPDGQWILLWESPAHGHRLLLYTPDGQLFRSLDATHLSASPSADNVLEPGIKFCQLSADGQRCAIGDQSRTVSLLLTATWRLDMSLRHPVSITPKDTLKVYHSGSVMTPGPMKFL